MIQPDAPSGKTSDKTSSAKEPQIIVKDGIIYEYYSGDLDAVQKALASQKGVLAALKGKYIKVAVVKNNVAEYPGIDPNEKPSGYAPGMTMKDVKALFFNESVIIISTSSLGSRTVRDRIFHEAGHAIDYFATTLDGRRASQRQPFVGAYKADLPAIKKMDGNEYFDTGDARGRREWYAESFRMMLTNRANLKQDFPNAYKYWNQKRW